jgi:hypothetical protein
MNPGPRFGFRCELIDMDLFAVGKRNAHVPYWLGFHLDRLEFRLGLTHSLTMKRESQSRHGEARPLRAAVS